MSEPRRLVPQQVPVRFADQLRRMRDSRDRRLNAVLATARRSGWRTSALASVLGIPTSAAFKRIERANPVDISDIVIPPPPPAERATMAGRALAPKALAELRRLHEQAQGRRRRDGMRPEHPSRQAADALATRLAELVEAGYTAYYLASVLGVTPRAVVSRLERHDYRKPCPSATAPRPPRTQQRRAS